jgi:hypothetical protein
MKAYAAWKARQGRPDSRGSADQALYFQKLTLTATFSAGVAEVRGLAGMPVSVLTGLSWEHRVDGHCGAGAPRWNVGVTLSNGQSRNVFLGCAAAVHTPGSAAGWVKDSYPGSDIQTATAGVLGRGEVAGARIRNLLIVFGNLLIVFDEGKDQGQGFVYLDNITVNDHVWTSASDNGNRW